MSTVFLAEDVRHKRQVALKVMRDDLSSALGTERFFREIRIAAGLTHPNIIPLLDSGEADGLLYYAMPFVRGESLRHRLRREDRLDLAEVLDVAREVSDALAYAHRNDVIHRDIKPENILLHEGHAMVADFGIARAITSASDEHLTRTGFPLGTVGYMSPEQAAGGTSMGSSTDIFSLACVCYEALIGIVPGKWLSPEENHRGRFIDVLPETRGRLDALPSHVEAGLVKAMAMHPAQRFEGADTFFNALTSPGPGRSYGTAEVRDIIKNAAQMEEHAESESDGLPSGSVVEMGAEVHIPEKFVRRAIRKHGSATPELEKGFMGWASRITATRSVRGEIYGNDYVFALEDIRAYVDAPGQASTIGNAFEWRTSNAGMAGVRDVQITITPRVGATEIRAVEKLRNQELFSAVAGLDVAILVGVGVTSFAIGVTAMLPAALIAGSGIFFAAKVFTDKKAAQKEKQLGELVDSLADRVAESRSRI